MIDTDKYEGHNISKVSNYQCGTATMDERKANWNLIQDAPLLLAEIERLRELIDDWDKDEFHYHFRKEEEE